jgi:DNA polymerase I-like protein with 3'-5' exonuclease and polymerase domains
MPKKIKRENVSEADLVVKVKKPKKPKVARDLRSVFRFHLKTLEIEKLKKPWMATKAFALKDTEELLQAWVDEVIADKTRWFEIAGTLCPVIALDTETIGLDTRLFYKIDADGQPIYEVMTDLAGICLSSNGIEGIYIPLGHEFADQQGNPATNISREAVRRILQPLFDICHLIFYNAKFDREIIRLCLGAVLRGYPYFEDVQVLQYIVDPKADVGDERRGQYTGDTGGLKALSKKLLDLEMINLDELIKVKADWFSAETQKTTQRVQYCPFTWVPLNIALYYAASDAICTWLLWFKLKDRAREQKLVHRIDQELVDSITWIERQRFLIDVARRERTVRWHTDTVKKIEDQLREIAVKTGWKTEYEEDGTTVIESSVFNPGSNPQVGKLLFGKEYLGLKSFKKTGSGRGESVDAEALAGLIEQNPGHEFLTLLARYKEYVALHPDNLEFDKRDNSARIYLKQNVVAGGRLSGAGGKFEVDGGFGLNPQGIVRVEGNWWVKGNVLEPDTIPEEEIEEHAEADLHPSCFKEIEEETATGEKRKVKKQAPNIHKNHIGFFQNYAICLVPSCTTCDKKFNILWRNGRMDANEVVNIRTLFYASTGWTFFTIDYSNIEMRAAANVSGEPEFIKEFLEGKGDFHSLTASKVFPEFNDPNTPKDVKKALRSLAKIINFALLYGGTEYTIFENMRKQNPDITWEEAKGMVERYWAGVEVFAEWCAKKQAIAKDKMICKTSTGRVINFQSGMEALHIHAPSEIEKENYWAWHRSCKKEKALAASEDESSREQAKVLHEHNDRMWRNTDTGIRNYQDYNRFMGKIGRIAVNVPLQGLAGDFMRISLNKIRIWACNNEPVVQSVLRVHCSVHDEVDFAVKNEYVPFVLPRISRLMKLRTMHEWMKWPVPIECDVEYGRSWDVEHHVTGDDGHKPAAWTAIAGMDNYIPSEFTPGTVAALVKAIESGVEAKLEKAKTWFKEALHERAFDAAKDLFNGKRKTHTEINQLVIAALQLHEFWTVDNIPDADVLETLEAFEARNGLSPQNRGIMPPTGFLGHVDPSKTSYPEIMKLGVATVVDLTPEFDAMLDRMQESGAIEGAQMAFNATPEELGKAAVEGARRIKDSGGTLPSTTEASKPQAPRKKGPAVKEIPELLDSFSTEMAERFNKAMGKGSNKIAYKYQGCLGTLHDVAATSIPDEFLKASNDKREPSSTNTEETKTVV